MKFYIKKIFAVFILAVLLLAFGCNKDMEEDEDGLFMYNESEYTIIRGIGGDREIPRSIEEAEERCKFFEGKEINNGLILIVSVAGKSKNITEIYLESESESGYNLTPVKIYKIVHMGKLFDYYIGDIITMREPYFYVTKDTPNYFEYYGEKTILLADYYPMLNSKKYLVFLLRIENRDYFVTCGLMEAVYCLSDDKPPEDVTFPFYDKLWEEAKAKYGSYVNKYKNIPPKRRDVFYILANLFFVVSIFFCSTLWL